VKRALVTGGASGLGAPTAARLRADGLAVTTLDVSGRADVVADVTDETALRRVADEIGPVDVLINSAGIIGANKPLLESTAEEWRRVFDVNVLGTVTARPRLRRCFFWSSLTGMTALMACRRSQARFARDEDALSLR
jgi:NAD(P)-dependent dehydrogenase (short-subunit alcohol dehydrogenase family)